MPILKLHPQLAYLLLGVTEAFVLFASPYLVHLLASNAPVVFDDLSLPALVFSLALSFSMIALGVHKSRLREGLSGMMLRTAVAFFVIGALSLAALYNVIDQLAVTPRTLAAWLIFSFVLVGALRWMAGTLLDRDFFKDRVLVLGTGENAGLILDRMRRKMDRAGFVIDGFVETFGTPKLVAARGARVVGLEGSLLEYCRGEDIHEIVVAVDESRRLAIGQDPLPIDGLLDCRAYGVSVIDVHDFIERETGSVEVDRVRPSSVIFSDGFANGRLLRWGYRAFDICFSLLLLLVTLPVMALTALAIKLVEGFHAPVLYLQIRSGRDNRPFQLIKFRSMKTDAEDDGQPVWAQINDARVTGIGRFIRKFRIDELPQLFNVLWGDMRLVGPRPERPESYRCWTAEFPTIVCASASSRVSRGGHRCAAPMAPPKPTPGQNSSMTCAT